MAQENVFIPKDEKTEKVEEKKVENKTEKKPVKEKKAPLDPKKNPLASLSNRFDKKRTKTIVGALLSMAACYFFLACLSYLFTWQADQDRVMDKSLLDFLFEENTEPVTNWLGKVGAWTSHLFIYRWFGISSFAFSFVIFIIGFKWLLAIQLFPITKTAVNSLVLMIWSSLFFGYFASTVNYLGGSFGYHINNWLMFTLGSFGSLVFILVLLYVVLVALFNPDFKALWNKYISKNFLENEGEELETVRVKPENSMADIHIINPIKEEQIIVDKPFEPVLFDDEDEDEEDADSDFEITMKMPETPKTVVPIEDDFEINIPEPTGVFAEPLDADDFTVVAPENDEILSDDEQDKLRKEYGDYDPTLDLSGYLLPSIDLLRDWGGGSVNINKQELEDNKNKIVETLSHYKIDISKIKATVGPTVTLYEIIPAPGVRISKIKNLEDDIALSLSALGIRIIAPIPGKGTIGIEVPNSNPEMVSMRSLIASEKFQNSDYELPVVIGKTITNETYTFDLTKMPHLLVAGSTGQGKSVGLNAILISILYKKHPSQVKFVLIDPKKVELTLYSRIERHFLAKLPGEDDAIITDTSKVVNTLNSLCIEMDTRYELLKDAQVRTIKEYNAKFISRRLNPENGHRYLPYIVVLIDEFADLIMTAGKEIEHPIARIAQLARAIGIHLIVATQRPSVSVITGMIKANFPARIAFRVQSAIDSRTILDASGANQLIGRGDMLISTGSEMIRLQCGFVDTPEVDEICAFIGNQRAYPEALILPEYTGEGGGEDKEIDLNDIDPMFADAARIVVTHQQGSASLLQRKLKLGYNRAGRIVDQLEGYGIIGPFQGSKAREVIYSDIEALEEFLKVKGIY
jgi:S-DNA-T family DNA segregation ATPase FtsK/SpoIIIE